jgi:iron uptake system component EfeO
VKLHRLATVVTLLAVPLLGACSDDDPAAGTSETTHLTDAQRELVEQGGNEYADWVRTETAALLSGTDRFVTAYKAGNDERARSLYAPTRMHWEAIEPVAESFGDLDPKTDAREADLEEGQEWTGWHLIEKDLWPQDAGADYEPLTSVDRAKYADQLLADLQTLGTEVQDATYSGEQIANGAKELLDEVATGKVTGEEETWSHTDLYDFQANVDGAKHAFDVLQPVVKQTEPELEAEIAEAFTSLLALLDGAREGKGFVSHESVTDEQRKTISDAVNALSEPLAKLAAAVAV